MRLQDGKVLVRGVSTDNGTIKEVVVNGMPARSLHGNFSEWEAVLPMPQAPTLQVTAHAQDEAGNVEKQPHRLTVKVQR